MSVETIVLKRFGPPLTFLIYKNWGILKILYPFLNQNCLPNTGMNLCFIRNKDSISTITVFCTLAKKPIFQKFWWRVFTSF